MNKMELIREINKTQNKLYDLEKKLKNYKEFNFESMIILNVNTSLKEFTNIKNDLLNFVGEFTKFEDIGLKILAYTIKNQKEGYYISFEFKATDEIVEEIEKYLKNNDNVLKFIFVKLDY